MLLGSKSLGIGLAHPIQEVFAHSNGLVLWFLPLLTTWRKALDHILGIADQEPGHTVSGLIPH